LDTTNFLKAAVDWKKPVEAINGSAVYRYKTKSNGMFKGYFTADYGDMSYNVPSAIENQPMLISNKGLTTYSNFLYRDCFSEKSCYNIGVSATTQKSNLGLGDDGLETA
jgi:hypothetical protein